VTPPRSRKRQSRRRPRPRQAERRGFNLSLNWHVITTSVLITAVVALSGYSMKVRDAVNAVPDLQKAIALNKTADSLRFVALQVEHDAEIAAVRAEHDAEIVKVQSEIDGFEEMKLFQARFEVKFDNLRDLVVEVREYMKP